MFLKTFEREIDEAATWKWFLFDQLASLFLTTLPLPRKGNTSFCLLMNVFINQPCNQWDDVWLDGRCSDRIHLQGELSPNNDITRYNMLSLETQHLKTQCINSASLCLTPSLVVRNGQYWNITSPSPTGGKKHIFSTLDRNKTRRQN